MSNLNSFVLWLLQHNFTKTNKRKGGKGGKLYTYTLMHLNFSHWIKKTDTDTYLLMGEPLCLAFSFCWCLTSSSFYSNCSLGETEWEPFFVKGLLLGVVRCHPTALLGFLSGAAWADARFRKGVIIKALRTTETLLCRQNGCNRISNGIKKVFFHMLSWNHYFYYSPPSLAFHFWWVKMNCNSYEMHRLHDDEIIWDNFSTFSCDSKLGWKRNVTFSKRYYYRSAYAKFPGKTMTH